MNSLLDNLLAFDIKIDDEDIYVPSTQQSSSTTINNFVIYSQTQERAIQQSTLFYLKPLL